VDVWRRYLRPGVLLGHVLVLAAALTCLRLGWWQWDVTHEAHGTVQNLGYALLWPVFAGSFIYMWLRFLHLEAAREADGVPDAAAPPAGDSIPDRGDGDREVAAPAAEPESQHEPGTDADRHPEPEDVAEPRRPRRERDRPRSVTIAVATVGDDEDDPELAAYNEALAALAEQDERGAR
jgi:hypothetical protein